MKPAGDGAFKGYTTHDLVGHKEKVYTVAWNCDGKRLASGSVDKTARVWTFDPSGPNAKGKIAKADFEFKGHTQSVDNLCWHPSNPDRLVTASMDKTVRIWDCKVKKAIEMHSGTGGNLNVTWSPDGNTIAFGNRDDVVTFFDVRTAKVINSKKFPYEVNELVWSNCGNAFFLTTGMSGSGTIEVLQYPTLEPLQSLKAHTASCYCISFDPSGRRFASGGADALVTLWDAEDLVCTNTFIRMDTAVRTLSFSHDSEHLAFAAEDSIIEIVETASGNSVHQIVCNTPPDSIAWNPKQKVLAYAGDDKMDHRGSLLSVGMFAPSS